ncbi:hypothetical protein BHL25_20145 [Bacillus cereus]|nr:hypothetical protein BHL25_20145 [Bacillus cereus]
MVKKGTKKLGKICLASGLIFTQVSTLCAFSTTAYAITEQQTADLEIKLEKDSIKVNEEITLEIRNVNQSNQQLEVRLPDGMSFSEDATTKLNEKNGIIGAIHIKNESAIQIEKKADATVLDEVLVVVKAKKAGEYKFTARVQQENNEIKEATTTILNVREEMEESKHISVEKSEVSSISDEREMKKSEDKIEQQPVKEDISITKESAGKQSEKVDSDKNEKKELKESEDITQPSANVTEVESLPANTDVHKVNQNEKKVEYAEGTSEVDVYDDKTLRAALNNKDVSKINITQDFIVNQSGYPVTSYPTRENLVIEGNGHTIDFRGLTAIFTARQNSKMNLTFKNARVIGANYYGFVRITGDVGAGTIRYEDIDYEGAQITASYEANVEFAGIIKAKTVTQYISLDGSAVTTLAGSVQQNIEATNIKFLEGSHYTGSTINSAVFALGNGGTVDVGKDAVINITAGGTGGESPRAAIETAGNFIVRDGAKVNIYTDPTSNKGGIYASGSKSKIEVRRGAELNVHTKGNLAGYPYYNSAIKLGNNASLEVADRAAVNVRSENTGSSSTSIVYAGNGSSFIIGKKSIFDVYGDGTASKNLIEIGSSAKFQFADAERVNLVLDNSNSSSRLINMAGSAGVLDVDIQRVNAWKSIGSTTDENADYQWTPMYGMKISYVGGNVKNVVANSVNEDTQNSFIQNFRTQNFKRVLFEYIEDVEVTIDSLSDKSQVITGITNPNALVRLSGDDAIPDPVINSSDINVKTKYHAIADSEGKYSFELPSGKHLTTGNTVKANAYLNGKQAEANTVVSDETAPDQPVLEDPIKDVSLSFKGKTEANAIVKIYSAEDDGLIGEVKAGGDGVYEFQLPVGKLPLVPGKKYYVTATDTAGNVSEKSNVATVQDTLPPSADPVIQTVKIGESLSNNPKDYVTNVKDNAGDSDENISYKVTKTPDVTKIGMVEAEVTLTDKAGNSTIVKVPVLVTNGQTIIGKEAALQAEDFSVVIDDVTNDEKSLHQLIFKEAGVKAWELPSGSDITNEVQIVDTGGLTNQIGEYAVILKVKDVEKTIKVDVIGGKLELVDVPQSISFGKVTIQSKEKVFNRTDMRGKVTVSDKRKDKNEWQVYVKQVTPLTSSKNDVLTDAIIYSKNGTDTVLNDQNHLAHSQASGNNDNVSLNWKESEGIRLKVNPGPNVKVNTEYHGELEWTLTDAPM